jgi:alkylhydroperoxidase/carboxymuconolactone decarboxylase family protein YurZ
VLSNEIGAGDIRADVQRAIEAELEYRLTGEDAPGALSRKEKELLLVALNGTKLNACLSQLHARAAVRAGATIEEVAHAGSTVMLVGMIRWKMAGQGAFTAAIAEAASRDGKAADPVQAGALNDMRAYVRKVLDRDFPDMWETLGVAAPGSLEGYMKLRQDIIRADPHSGALPKKFIELCVVSCDIIQANDWGAKMHVRQAVRDGLTPAQAVEGVALAMIEAGVQVYHTGGREVILEAEDESKRS